MNDATRRRILGATQLVCPPPRPMCDTEARTFDRALVALRRLPERLSTTAAFGLELRVASQVLNHADQFPKADNDFWPAKCKNLFLRPAVEPIIFQHYKNLRLSNLDIISCRDVASKLVGVPVKIRDRPIFGSSQGREVCFEQAAEGREWIKHLKRASQEESLDLMLPVFVFTKTICSHPLSDGNGRLARLLLRAALGDLAGMGCLSLPLAPSIYRHSSKMESALINLSETLLWDKMISVVICCITETLMIIQTLES